jgi:hypothetical protein
MAPKSGTSEPHPSEASTALTQVREGCYNQHVDDTHPDVRRRQLELLRSAGFERRATLALSLSQSVIDMSRRALREQMPEASEEEVRLRWAGLQYGEALEARLRASMGARRK